MRIFYPPSDSERISRKGCFRDIKVNFGAISDSGVSTYGPRAALQYDLGAKVKDLFIVWRDGSDTAATTSHFLGQTDGTDFARKASGYLFDASKASPLVCNGLLRLPPANF